MNIRMESQREDSILNSENVEKVFNACQISRETIESESIPSNYTVLAGVTSTYYLDNDKLKEKKEEIKNMISRLQGIETGEVFLNLFITKANIEWTNDKNVLDHLIVLGLASGEIKPYDDIPRDKWETTYKNDYGVLWGMPIFILAEKKEKTYSYYRKSHKFE